jgi:hypothetical protein
VVLLLGTRSGSGSLGRVELADNGALPLAPSRIETESVEGLKEETMFQNNLEHIKSLQSAASTCLKPMIMVTAVAVQITEVLT